MYIKKRIGPTTEPWDTPDVTLTGKIRLSVCLSACLKELIWQIVEPLMP